MKLDRPIIFGMLLGVSGTTLGAVAQYQFDFGNYCLSPTTIGTIIGFCVGVSLMNAMRSRQ